MMTTDLLHTILSPRLFLAALLVFGFAPGAVLRLIVLAFRRDDPRRRELLAELCAVPRFERPFWVFEKLELALFEGIWPRMAEVVVHAGPWRVRYLTTQAFMHVKELTKAEQYETHKAMRRRYRSTVRETRRQQPLGRIIDEGGMHPPTLIANPRQYVKLQFGPMPWPRLQNIRSVTVRWTPLVLSPSEEFFEQLTAAVAHFLRVSPHGLVAHQPDLYRKRVTFLLR